MEQYVIDLLSDDLGGGLLPEDLDYEDIPEEHLNKIRLLLDSQDKYTVFQAAKLLTFWGDDFGFNKLEKLFYDKELKGFIDHRLYGYDDTLQHVLRALVSFWTQKIERGQGLEAREKIFPYVVKIIENSNEQPFEIYSILGVIDEYGFNEYLPFIKKHLQKIIEHPEIHGWKIHDVIKLLLKVDPIFVESLLKRNNKKLADYGL